MRNPRSLTHVSHTREFQHHKESLQIYCWLMIAVFIYAPFTFNNCHMSVSAVSSDELCATKICSGCIAGSLSCQEGGLTSLPDEVSSDIQSIIFIGHRFDTNYLLRENFSNYPLHTKLLQRLTLRNCEIERLQPGALQLLSNLTQLDLSQNRIKSIEPNTFIGLRLELLRLDENHGLVLEPGAFGQTSIASLSMNHCDLQSLLYEDLLPLFQNGALTNLHLAGNKLFTLESRLEPIILGLQSLSIEQNPFLCDCKTQWLVHVLRKRSIRRTVRALPWSSVKELGSIYQVEEPKDIDRGIPLDGDTLKPVCKAPARLAGRLIEKLRSFDFFCEMPLLKSLEIDLSQLNVNAFAKSSNSGNDHQEIIDGNSEFKVTLRCEVRGSPELDVSWYQPVITRAGLTSKLNPNTDSLKKMNHVKLINPGLAELQFIRHGTAYRDHIDQILCVANDLNGNASAEITLKWPFLTEFHPKSESDTRTTNSKLLYLNAESVQEVERAKRINVDVVETVARDDDMSSNWYILTGEDPNGFWLKKQFSALQMIGAVVGTFTTTLLLFVIGCFLLKARRLHHSFAHSKVPPNHDLYLHNSPNNTYSAPPSYSLAPTQSSPSVVYQIPNGLHPESFSGLNTQIPCYFNTTNKKREKITFPCELDVNKRQHYATYEPIPIKQIPSASAYSDSQTYDIPQLPINLSPPSVPLPPVPTGNVQTFGPNSQTLKSLNSFLIPNTTCVPKDGLHNESSGFSTVFYSTQVIPVPATLPVTTTLGRVPNPEVLATSIPINTSAKFTQSPYPAALAAATLSAQHQLLKNMGITSNSEASLQAPQPVQKNGNFAI